MIKAHNSFIDWLVRLFINPRFVLFCLALYNLLDVPVRYAPLCPYNYQDQFFLAFLILLAASAVWLNQWWSCLGAAFYCSKLVLGFVFLAVEVFFLTTPNEMENQTTRDNWINFMSNNLDVPLQILLAAAILVFAVIGLVRSTSRHRITLL